jgi:hypothetical protein
MSAPFRPEAGPAVFITYPSVAGEWTAAVVDDEVEQARLAVRSLQEFYNNDGTVSTYPLREGERLVPDVLESLPGRERLGLRLGSLGVDHIQLDVVHQTRTRAFPPLGWTRNPSRRSPQLGPRPQVSVGAPQVATSIVISSSEPSIALIGPEVVGVPDRIEVHLGFSTDGQALYDTRRLGALPGLRGHTASYTRQRS